MRALARRLSIVGCLSPSLFPRFSLHPNVAVASLSHLIHYRRFRLSSIREVQDRVTLPKFFVASKWMMNQILKMKDGTMKPLEVVLILPRRTSEFQLFLIRGIFSHGLARSSWPSTAALSRTHQDRLFHHSDRMDRGRSVNTSLFPHQDGKLNLAVPSSREDYDRDDEDSTCDPSPVSPETPHDRPGLVPLSILKERGAGRSPSSFPGAAPLSLGRDWTSDHRTGGIRKGAETVNEALPRSTDARLSACRHSCEGDGSDDEPGGHPLRPW